jgi:hypothetical protein
VVICRLITLCACAAVVADASASPMAIPRGFMAVSQLR